MAANNLQAAGFGLHDIRNLVALRESDYLAPHKSNPAYADRVTMDTAFPLTLPPAIHESVVTPALHAIRTQVALGKHS